MQEITGALIGIALVLTAVFLPMAFFGGSTGVIYRQFSVTIVSAMSLSITGGAGPDALAVRHAAQARREGEGHRSMAASSPGSTATSTSAATGISTRWNGSSAGSALGACWSMPASSSVLVVLFVRLPTGFLPDEDQGFIFNLITLPAGTTQPRT